MTMTLNGTDGVTFNDTSLQGAAASPYVLKNRIINGAMEIDQRNAGASVTISAAGTSAAYVVDRFQFQNNITSGTMTVQRSTTVPTGFSNSVIITNGAAVTAAASNSARFWQPIEGFNFADLNFGSANAKTITLSFWVRSSLTGTYAGGLVNESANRSYVFTYSISSANTWEQKSITITGDTTGTWTGATNAIGAYVFFDLGSGSDRNGTANTWNASYAHKTSGSINWVGTNGATFYITGVQLEVGSTATPFERRLYGQELINCQRYYQTLPFDAGFVSVGAAINTTSARGPLLQLNVNMRAAPTITLPAAGSGAGQLHYTTSSGAVPGTIGTNSALGVQVNSFRVEGDSYTSAFTAGNSTLLRVGTGAGASITASAEL